MFPNSLGDLQLWAAQEWPSQGREHDECDGQGEMLLNSSPLHKHQPLVEVWATPVPDNPRIFKLEPGTFPLGKVNKKLSAWKGQREWIWAWNEQEWGQVYTLEGHNHTFISQIFKFRVDTETGVWLGFEFTFQSLSSGLSDEQTFPDALCGAPWAAGARGGW